MPAIYLASSLPLSQQHHYSLKKCFRRTPSQRRTSSQGPLLMKKVLQKKSDIMTPAVSADESTNIFAVNLNFFSKQQQVIKQPLKSSHCLSQDSNKSGIGKGRSGDSSGNGPSGGGGSRKNYGDSCPEMPEPAKTEGIRNLCFEILPGLVGFFIGAYVGLMLLKLPPNSLFTSKTFIEVFTGFALFMGFQKKANDFSRSIFFATNILVGVIASIELVDRVARMGPKLSLFNALSGCLLLAFASLASRSIKNSAEDIPASRIVKSAALSGVFCAVSSSPLARVLPVALAFTAVMRKGQNRVDCPSVNSDSSLRIL